ncbi:hypothetical protein FOL47_010556, partial [Perkinsus chesapeaki]
MRPLRDRARSLAYWATVPVEGAVGPPSPHPVTLGAALCLAFGNFARLLPGHFHDKGFVVCPGFPVAASDPLVWDLGGSLGPGSSAAVAVRASLMTLNITLAPQAATADLL